MATNHRMTPARRAALKKAQAASAKKRRGKGKGKLAKANRSNSRFKKAAKYTAIGVGVAAAAGAAGYAAHKNSQRHNKRMSMHAPNTDFTHAANSLKKSRLGLSKKQHAKAKAAGAAHGSSGSHKRTFVGHAPPKKSKAKYHQESRLRQHHKAGEVGMYHAGLGSRGTKTHVMGTGKKKRKRR